MSKVLFREVQSNGVAPLVLLVAFRCDCGQLCAMADQLNGNAAMVHGWPRCLRFDGLEDQHQALAYFRSLEQVALTAAVEAELLQNSGGPLQ